ncbi:nickel-responsive transcriptional regulator NikR [Candidatus Woesearchaeota archaeon]|nr:nickel-responsive transcriptional regulator NikR [Candidatus Woesearchaeota archaeon]
MEKITRKSIAFGKKELPQFDRMIAKRGYKNRSEAVRDLVRDSLVKEKTEDPKSKMMATLTIVYNHHDHDVQHNLTHIQHHHPGLIISAMHTHMNKDDCMEVIVLRGKVRDIKSLGEMMIAAKGVRHGKLVLTGN